MTGPRSQSTEAYAWGMVLLDCVSLCAMTLLTLEAGISVNVPWNITHPKSHHCSDSSYFKHSLFRINSPRPEATASARYLKILFYRKLNATPFAVCFKNVFFFSFQHDNIKCNKASAHRHSRFSGHRQGWEGGAAGARGDGCRDGDRGRRSDRSCWRSWTPFIPLIQQLQSIPEKQIQSGTEIKNRTADYWSLSFWREIYRSFKSKFTRAATSDYSDNLANTALISWTKKRLILFITSHYKKKPHWHLNKCSPAYSVQIEVNKSNISVHYIICAKKGYINIVIWIAGIFSHKKPQNKTKTAGQCKITEL